MTGNGAQVRRGCGMQARNEPQEIFLNPGAFAFGEGHTRIRTILGSCVAVTFWNPELKTGAMCHYMLPSRPAGRSAPLDGRYGDEVIEMITDKFRIQELQPRHFQVKLFGGSNMSPGLGNSDAPSIGMKNIEIGARLLKEKGFSIRNADVGHCQHRTIIFDVRSGEVWVRRGPSGCEMKCVFKPEEGCPHLREVIHRHDPKPSV